MSRSNFKSLPKANDFAVITVVIISGSAHLFFCRSYFVSMSTIPPMSAATGLGATWRTEIKCAFPGARPLRTLLSCSCLPKCLVRRFRDANHRVSPQPGRRRTRRALCRMWRRSERLEIHNSAAPSVHSGRRHGDDPPVAPSNREIPGRPTYRPSRWIIHRFRRAVVISAAGTTIRERLSKRANYSPPLGAGGFIKR